MSSSPSEHVTEWGGEQTNQCVEFCNGCVDTLLPRIGRCYPGSVRSNCKQRVNTGDAYVDEHWLLVQH